ncbi:hypothetical protein R70211_02151 [Paraburkholderia domus]|uniref:Uncharacterized protein n=1 Tax=Paraburkholderia domus TaxID=2793075 RepID=A0A9N8QVJ1_9BURK|nr:hypothetical protein R70211_02151 [Paraburkholderia domus]
MARASGAIRDIYLSTGKNHRSMYDYRDAVETRKKAREIRAFFAAAWWPLVIVSAARQPAAHAHSQQVLSAQACASLSYSVLRQPKFPLPPAPLRKAVSPQRWP